jgi:hypothetical protein
MTMRRKRSSDRSGRRPLRSPRVSPAWGSSRHRRRGTGAGGLRSVESFKGERPPRTVPNEPLETRSVLALDADGAIDIGRRH